MMMNINDVINAMSEFPPKLSVLMEPMADFEKNMEATFSSTTGVNLPPGPAQMTQSMMANIENNMPTPASAGLPLPKITGLESIQSMLPPLPHEVVSKVVPVKPTASLGTPAEKETPPPKVSTPRMTFEGTIV